MQREDKTSGQSLYGFNLSGVILTLLLLFPFVLYSYRFNLPIYYRLFSILILLFLLTYIIALQESKRRLLNRYKASNAISLSIMNSNIHILSTLLSFLEMLKFSEKGNKQLEESYITLKANLEKMEGIIKKSYSHHNLLISGEGIKKHNSINKEILKEADNLKNEFIKASDYFFEVYIKNKESLKDSMQNMASLIYYLGTSIPILSDFTKIFNEFSKNLIIEIINRFSNISKFNHQIIEKIEEKIDLLMNEEKEDSLAFIIKKTHDLVDNFDSLYSDMEKLKISSDAFSEKTAEKLQDIQNIANSIEEIVETIKVLSLNVSIEAANTGEIGKGFQVLARDLREFTKSTVQFAHEVKAKGNDALITIQSLKSNYIESMDKVYQYINDIKNSIHVFEEAIRNSIEKIKNIITDIKDFSERIDNDIKEVVGKLQYYDITSQEVDHLGIFIQKIFVEVFNEKMPLENVNKILSEDEMVSIKRNILQIIKEFITTANEREVLNKYEELFGLKSQDEIEIEKKMKEIIKSEDKNIFLFK